MADQRGWGAQPGPEGTPGGGYPPPPSSSWGQPPGYQQPGYQQPGYQSSVGFPPAPPIGPNYGYEYSVPPGMHFDPESGLTLPAGVVLASAGRRIGAWFLAIPLLIVTLGIGYVLWGLIAWGRGQTPALQVLGMRCWTPVSNRVAGWWRMALREVIGRFLEQILSLITLAISFVLMLATKDRRTIHDMVAGTVVVRDPNKVLGRY